MCERKREREKRQRFISAYTIVGRMIDKEMRANKRYTLESQGIQERIHLSMNTKEDKAPEEAGSQQTLYS